MNTNDTQAGTVICGSTSPTPQDDETKCLNSLVNIFEEILMEPERRVRVLNYLNERYHYLYDLDSEIDVYSSTEDEA